MKTDEPMTISIVGKGAVGTALANQCAQKGVEVRFVRILREPVVRESNQAGPNQAGPNQEALNQHSSKHDVPTEYSLDAWLNDLSQQRPQKHWVILAVPDDAIMPTVDRILKGWQTISDKPLTSAMDAIAHTSGGRSSEDFQHFQDQGIFTASMHPIQTFHKSAEEPNLHPGFHEQVNPFDSINITLEGDAPFLPQLTHFCQQILDAHPIDVTRTQKQQIHAAAVLASNYLFPNLSLASTYLQDAGLSPTLLEPLASQTVQAALHQGLAAISGPVARLDHQTIRRNMDVLSSHSATKQRYIDESIILVNQLLESGHYDGKREQAQDLLKMLHAER
ncbi:MAG: DUF2520 domain-containing protein [Balneolaceae bacterium]|nr:DUF2520 domain-containing protein [Balneolaceae bacterium]